MRHDLTLARAVLEDRFATAKARAAAEKVLADAEGDKPNDPESGELLKALQKRVKALEERSDDDDKPQDIDALCDAIEKTLAEGDHPAKDAPKLRELLKTLEPFRTSDVPKEGKKAIASAFRKFESAESYAGRQRAILSGRAR